jgi:acyl-CoA thioesterase-1
MRYLLSTFLLLLPSLAALAESTVEGLIIPRDNTGMYVRNPDGQFEIEWTDQTKVALEVNTRLFAELKGNVLRYHVHSSKQKIDFALPEGPITGVVTARKGRTASMLKEAADEKWIGEHGLKLYFNQKPTEQLASEADPRFVGLWDPTSKPRTLSINGKRYECSLKKGGQTNALLYNVFTTADCTPFNNRARVVGVKKGDIIEAREIHVQPIGDQTAKDDPKLPRYLFIGDSISGNYDKGLRAALGGKYNIHHPPTNCGPSRNGRDSIIEWLGAYKEKGRHWDVISFNHGHWDSGQKKADYQANLETIIVELKKTKAKLIWVTTCPVPDGYDPTGELKDGKAPGRTAGVMKKYLNPWALEVMQRHPEISICDQWQYVEDNRDSIYKDWWPTRDVHFKGAPGAKLGEFLAEHVEKVMK